LRVAEAALTGESVSVTKEAERTLATETPLADRLNMAYASTLVTSGQGKGVVVATGDETEIGRISTMISSAGNLETPLTRKMAAFGQTLLILILALAGVVIAIGWWRGESWDHIVSAAIALAVGAIPEGLPAAVTVTLAIGVARMARRRAIIRRLPAVETLGSTTVICSDKTGTLTQNQMTVRRLVVDEWQVEVSGQGYQPEGALTRDGGAVDVERMSGIQECALAGLLCNDSSLAHSDQGWEPHGDPTEVALIVCARKAGLDPEAVRARHPRLDSIPFESHHQFMATLHREASTDRRVVYIKGAAEVVLNRCTAAVDGQGGPRPLDRSRVLAQMGELAGAGMRVLAFARAEVTQGIGPLTLETLPSDFTWLGLQGMIDPARPEAIQAVAACHRAGIRVKMITGDHAGTAAAIGRQLGLIGKERGTEGGGATAWPECLSGAELARLPDTELVKAAEAVSVFARVTPEQKLRLVEALQARGQVVAMTGDGVNDGPALKQADIGVAMGITGTEVAKEASDMVLADDNFASIEAAVEEGRNVFENLRKIIAWALPSNLGQGLVILAAAIAGVVLPILPLQILWINMTTGGVLGLLLALEPNEPDLMERPPRPANSPILTGSMLCQISLVGLLILVTAFGLFRWELARGASVDAARTVALNTVALVQAFYLLNCRSLNHSLLAIGLFRNLWLWLGVLAVLVVQAALTYVPFLNGIFQTAPIGWDEWLRILASGLAGLVLVEIAKVVQNAVWPPLRPKAAPMPS